MQISRVSELGVLELDMSELGDAELEEELEDEELEDDEELEAADDNDDDDDMPEDLKRVKRYLLTLERPDGMTDRVFNEFRQYAVKPLMHEGLLFRRAKPNMPPKRVLWNNNEQNDIIRQLHDESGHRGTKRTYGARQLERRSEDLIEAKTNLRKMRLQGKAYFDKNRRERCAKSCELVICTPV